MEIAARTQVPDAPLAGDVIVARVNGRSVGLLIVTESANHCLYAPCDTMWQALQRAREVAAMSSVDVWHHTPENTFERIASYRTGQLSLRDLGVTARKED
jgi:hypothetical protein